MVGPVRVVLCVAICSERGSGSFMKGPEMNMGLWKDKEWGNWTPNAATRKDVLFTGGIVSAEIRISTDALLLMTPWDMFLQILSPVYL